MGVAVGDTLPHGIPGSPDTAGVHETFQVTPAFAASLLTVAVNCAVAPGCTVAVAGATDTVMPAGTVIITEAVFVPSATEVAVSVTLRSLAGGIAGAV